MRQSPNFAAPMSAQPLLSGDKHVIGNEVLIPPTGSRKPMDQYPVALSSGMPSAGGAQPPSYSTSEAILSAGGLQGPVGVAFSPYHPVDPLRTTALTSHMHYQPNPNPALNTPNYAGQLAASPMMFGQSGALGGVGPPMYPSRGPISSCQPYAYVQLMGNSRDNLVFIPAVYPSYHQDTSSSGSRPIQMSNHGQFFAAYPIIGIDSHHSSAPYGYSDRPSSLLGSTVTGTSSLRPHAMIGTINNSNDLSWPQTNIPTGFPGNKDFIARMVPGAASTENSLGSSSRLFGGYSGPSNAQIAPTRPKEESAPQPGVGELTYRGGVPRQP
jgi:hypothetical protein